jgi:membrane-associated protease RseP (regulator of RpoE activity)
VLVSLSRFKLASRLVFRRAGERKVGFAGQKRAGMRQRRRSERGEGKLKAVIVTGILLLGVFAGIKVIPPYVAYYQLNDKVQEIARFGVVEHSTEDQIKEKVFKTIEDLEIPATREDIRVSALSTRVSISVDYKVPVDILFYHVDLHFNPNSENKSLT